MHTLGTPIVGVVEIGTRPNHDDRGSFREVFNSNHLPPDCALPHGQLNQSISRFGVIRGLHWQEPAQRKLCWVSRGRAFDVIVDLRRDFESFGRVVTRELNCFSCALVIPAGCAHGFQSLENGTVFSYMVDPPYSGPANQRGIRFDSLPDRIRWPVPPDPALISAQDKYWPTFDQFVSGSL